MIRLGWLSKKDKYIQKSAKTLLSANRWIMNLFNFRITKKINTHVLLTAHKRNSNGS